MGDPSLFVGIHHLRPLPRPGLLLVVELHTTPKWLEGRASSGGLRALRRGRPAPGGPYGFLVLPSEHHVPLLAAHSWAREPRRRDLADNGLVVAAADPAETARLARCRGIARLWEMTCAVVEALRRGGRSRWSSGSGRGASGLHARGRSFESHLE